MTEIDQAALLQSNAQNAVQAYTALRRPTKDDLKVFIMIRGMNNAVPIEQLTWVANDSS